MSIILRGAALCLALILALPASAGDGRLDRLAELLRVPEVMEIMRDEGLAHGRDIGQSLLGDRVRGDSARRWERMLDQIYDLDLMRARFDAVLARHLDPDNPLVDEIIAFFDSPRGRALTALELAARRAMSDDEAEAQAAGLFAELDAADDPRLGPIRSFARTNQLVDLNVTGALNASYAFYKGLVESGAPDFDTPEADILADVWQQEAEIRAEMEAWVFAFLTLAYLPADPEDLAVYVAFSESEAGQALNLALFAAFDAMFVEVSQALGMAAGQMGLGEDI